MRWRGGSEEETEWVYTCSKRMRLSADKLWNAVAVEAARQYPTRTDAEGTLPPAPYPPAVAITHYLLNPVSGSFDAAATLSSVCCARVSEETNVRSMLARSDFAAIAMPAACACSWPFSVRREMSDEP